MDSTWQYGGCMMNFINILKRMNWPIIIIMGMTIIIWYGIIKLIGSIIA